MSLRLSIEFDTEGLGEPLSQGRGCLLFPTHTLVCLAPEVLESCRLPTPGFCPPYWFVRFPAAGRASLPRCEEFDRYPGDVKRTNAVVLASWMRALDEGSSRMASLIHDTSNPHDDPLWHQQASVWVVPDRVAGPLEYHPGSCSDLRRWDDVGYDREVHGSLESLEHSWERLLGHIEELEPVLRGSWNKITVGGKDRREVVRVGFYGWDPYEDMYFGMALFAKRLVDLVIGDEEADLNSLVSSLEEVELACDDPFSASRLSLSEVADVLSPPGTRRVLRADPTSPRFVYPT